MGRRVVMCFTDIAVKLVLTLVIHRPRIRRCQRIAVHHPDSGLPRWWLPAEHVHIIEDVMIRPRSRTGTESESVKRYKESKGRNYYLIHYPDVWAC